LAKLCSEIADADGQLTAIPNPLRSGAILPPISLYLVEELSGRQHPDAAPWVQYQQIRVSRHNDTRVGGKRQFQVTVVLGIPAVVDFLRRFDP
jgi:hypothetical protein